MTKKPQVVKKFTSLNFLYHDWAEDYGVFYETWLTLRLKLSAILHKPEPFFGDWVILIDLVTNNSRPHHTLRHIRDRTYINKREFFEYQVHALNNLFYFWQTGLTFITYTHKLSVHFCLPFTEVALAFGDLYFSILLSLNEMIDFCLENTLIADSRDKTKPKFFYLNLILCHILAYPDFVNFFFTWSSQSLKYKDKWTAFSAQVKVREVLIAELGCLSEEILYRLSVNLPLTLEQHKENLEKEQRVWSNVIMASFDKP